MTHRTNLMLTDQQQAFVSNYIKNGFNGTRAAIDAGYSESGIASYASKLTQHPLIKPRIEKARQALTEEFEKELGITLKDKTRILMRIINEIIPCNGETDKRYLKYALQAMAELNKMQGHYMPDKTLKVTVDATKERLLEARRKYQEY